MANQQPCYLAYMLRLWRVGSGDELAWRASLESPHTGERHGFASLEALFAFLEDQAKSKPIQPEEPPAAPSLDAMSSR